MNKLAARKAQKVVENLEFYSSSCVKRNFTYINSPPPKKTKCLGRGNKEERVLFQDAVN
jgi:hypothetical protein